MKVAKILHLDYNLLKNREICPYKVLRKRLQTVITESKYVKTGSAGRGGSTLLPSNRKRKIVNHQIFKHLNFFIMNALRNKVQLIGNLGQTPEIKSFEGGRKMARFSLVTNESYRNANGDTIKDAQWHNVVAWGKTAEIIEKFCDKGKEVGIEGRLVNRSYNGKDGEKKYITEVQVSEVLLLGSKKES